jgi:murein tripeptide amidase MpaA
VFKSALVGCAALALATVVITGQSPHQDASRTPDQLDTLAGVFSGPHAAVRDTNGDGLNDAVSARVILPDTPTADDIEAAANIAARLGYETTALTMPLVVRDTEVTTATEIGLPILVGRQNRYVRALVERGGVDLTSLQPGQGLIALVPSPLGKPSGVVVAGGDDAGTLAAGVELGARLPRLWNMTGVTLGGIEEQVAAFLASHGVAGATVRVTYLVVDAERRGIRSIGVRAEVAPGLVARTAAALNDLDAAHRRGQGERTIDFAEAAVTTVDIVAGGTKRAEASVRRSGLNARTLTPPVDPDEFAPEPNAAGVIEPRLAPARPFDLTNTYTIDGWFGDAYQDLIPDRTDTTLVVGDATDTLGAAHIAARLGLETTGITLPITKRDEKVREPGAEPSPILVGRNNTLVQQLIKIGKTRLDDLHPGEGEVQIVPRAFGNATATVVAGADPAGTLAASRYLAGRAPYLWDVRRGAPTYEDLAGEVTKFLAARSGAGQASLATVELKAILDDIKGKSIESFGATLYIEKGDKALDAHLASQVKSVIGQAAAVTVTSQGVTDPATVFEDKIEIPWEVDDFRARFKSAVLPAVKAGAKVDLEARLSEPRSIRDALAAETTSALKKAGASDVRVRVLSAYKQGYSWLTEEVVPALKGRGAKSVRVRIATYKPDLKKPFKFYTLPTRWLHELYPVDEVFQRDLAVPIGAFRMELADDAKDIYAVEASDANGRVVYSGTFSPKFVEREYLEKFPGWSRIEVTTGWVTARVNGQLAVDARIETDPERFWDYYQAKVLPRIYDNVMKVTGGKPTADKQPFHRDLDIEVWMSEPDEKIGIDEEVVSSLEALHEDIYFVTLDFFAAMGRTLTKNRLNAPGKVFPIVHPARPGKPGEARVLYAGNASTKAKLEVTYTEKGAASPTVVSRDLSRIDTTAPRVLRAVARDDRVSEIELQVDAKDDKEATRAVDAIDGLATLQAAGLYKTALSFDHVDRVAVAVLLKDARTRRVVQNTGESTPSNVRTAPEGAAPPHVAWDHIIGPDESEQLVAALAASPAVHSFKVGQSYRGRDVSAMEITLPVASELVSTAKLTAYKPTILMIGRQHANEVSSTSHILRLGELLATDPAYRTILEKVNVVLCPTLNPDGAAMAYELQKMTPTWMLHAGRYSALGMDITSRAIGLLPEAEIEGKLWRQWLPDIYLNPHGYPSHEWVQPFSGYVAPGFRAYWSPRGWYTMLSGLRDPRYPGQEEATSALREAIVREINGSADVHAMCLRQQDRYRRWAAGFSPYVFGVEIYKDTMIYYSDQETGEPRGSRRATPSPSGAAGGRVAISAWPQVTFMSGMTEAPDETAQGEWLSLVTKAGFSFLMAHVKYLEAGQYRVERIEEGAARDGAQLTTLRVRPVMPAAGKDKPARLRRP